MKALLKRIYYTIPMLMIITLFGLIIYEAIIKAWF